MNTVEADVRSLSAQAFALAKDVAADGGTATAAQLADAEAMRSRLTPMWADLAKAGDSVRADLERLLSEAGLDIDYVSSGGGLSTSIRLHHFLTDQR